MPARRRRAARPHPPIGELGVTGEAPAAPPPGPTAPSLGRRCGSEFAGTFALVVAGCGAAAVDHATGGAIGHAGVALTFGLVVFAAIETVGPTGGAHLNPAVTLAFALAGRLRWRDVVPYALTQFAAALVAAFALRWLLGAGPTAASAAVPNAAAGVTAAGAFGLELLLTCGLMTVILAVATGPKEKGLTAGLTIGATVGWMALAFGPVCGASMNPARSLGPAVAGGAYDGLWVYLIAQPLGAAAAVPLYRAIRPG